jgi:putative membrane protein
LPRRGNTAVAEEPVMRRPIRLVVHAAGVLALLAAGALPAQPASGPPAAASAAASAARALARADINFMQNAAQAGHAEMEASKLALQRARHTQVRAFAQQMVDDHGKAGQELATLAAAKQVKLPDKPSITQRASLKLLSTAADDKFDERYAKSFGVRAHRDTVALFQKAANGVADAELRAFAGKTLPVVQQHLTQAEEMLRAVERDGKPGQPAAASAPKR